MDDVNHLLDRLRGELADVESRINDWKEMRREIRDRKESIEADYEYTDKRVKMLQSEATKLKKRINSILSSTGV